MSKKRKVTIIDSGIVFHEPDKVFGYYAWPSVAKNENGEIVIACSGDRAMHICPFGRVLVRISKDEGKNWASPIVAIDTPLDDRDAGILNLGGGKMILTSFNNNCAFQKKHVVVSGLWGTKERVDLAHAYLPVVSEEAEKKYVGSLMSISVDNGYTWSEPYKVPVTAPHGPNVLKDGSLIYAGASYEVKDYSSDEVIPYHENTEFPIVVYKSKNYRDFEKIAEIPICPELGPHFDYCEPHIIELENGRLVLHIRADEQPVITPERDKRTFTIVQTVSDDGGKTWSTPKAIGCKNSPPHLLQHSSGTLICAYGHRVPKYGVEVMFSDDNGDTWDIGYPIWDEGYNLDLGYPCSIELDNGDIFTVYYGRLPGEEKASILWTRWSFEAE